MTSEVSEAFKGFGMLRGGLAAGAAGLALFGFEIARQSKALVEYADKIRSLNQQARQIGVNPAQLKDTIEQLQAFGISGETAVASIGAVSAKIADLQRQGSQLRLELMKNAGPDRESVRNMSDYLDRLTNAKSVAEQLNIIREGGEQVFNNARKQGYSEQEAANRRNNFWQLQGYNAQLANAGKLEEMTQEEQRLAEQRQKNAEALSNRDGQADPKWETLVETMKQPFIMPMLSALKMAEGALDSITAKLNEIQEKQLVRPDKAQESIQEKFGKFGLTGPSFEDRWKERVPQELEKNTEATKALTDLLRAGGYQPTSFGGGGFGGGGIIPAAFHPGGGGSGGGIGGAGASHRDSFGGGGYANLGGSGGGGAPYGSDTGGDTGTGAPGPAGDPAVPSDILQKRRRSRCTAVPVASRPSCARRAIRRLATGAASSLHRWSRSAGGTPPKNPAIASNWRNWGTPVEVRRNRRRCGSARWTRTGMQPEATSPSSKASIRRQAGSRSRRQSGAAGRSQHREPAMRRFGAANIRAVLNRTGPAASAASNASSVAAAMASICGSSARRWLAQLQRRSRRVQVSRDWLRSAARARTSPRHRRDPVQRTTAPSRSAGEEGTFAAVANQMIDGRLSTVDQQGLLRRRVAQLERTRRG